MVKAVAARTIELDLESIKDHLVDGGVPVDLKSVGKKFSILCPNPKKTTITFDRGLLHKAIEAINIDAKDFNNNDVNRKLFNTKNKNGEKGLALAKLIETLYGARLRFEKALEPLGKLFLDQKNFAGLDKDNNPDLFAKIQKIGEVLTQKAPLITAA